MNLDGMHLKHFPRPKVNQLGKNWPQLMVLIYVKLMSHMAILKNSEIFVKLPLSNEQFASLQENDDKIHALKEKVADGLYSDFYFIHKGILYRSIIDNSHKFRAAVVPEALIGTVLYLAHNQSGHNGYQRTYAAIKHMYYWKGMRKHVLVHCKNCVTCAKKQVKKTQFEKQIFEPGVQPMEFICINLIGEFHPPSSKGNRYTLTMGQNLKMIYSHRLQNNWESRGRSTLLPTDLNQMVILKDFIIS